MVGSFGSDGSQGSVGLDDIHFEATTKLQGFLNWFELVLEAKPCRVHVATNKRNIAFGFFVYPLFRSTGWRKCPSLISNFLFVFLTRRKKNWKHKLKFVLFLFVQVVRGWYHIYIYLFFCFDNFIANFDIGIHRCVDSFWTFYLLEKTTQPKNNKQKFDVKKAIKFN